MGNNNFFTGDSVINTQQQNFTTNTVHNAIEQQPQHQQQQQLQQQQQQIFQHNNHFIGRYSPYWIELRNSQIEASGFFFNKSFRWLLFKKLLYFYPVKHSIILEAYLLVGSFLLHLLSFWRSIVSCKKKKPMPRGWSQGLWIPFSFCKYLIISIYYYFF